MADEENIETTEETAPAVADVAPESEEGGADATQATSPEASAEGAEVPGDVAAEGDAVVAADVDADADVTAAEETPAAEEAAPTAAAVPPITRATTPTERREARVAARLVESGSRPTRTAEERQAERETARRAKAVARRTRRHQEREAYKASEHERVPTPAREHVVGQKKTRQGIVVSDKASKTITVRIDVARPHRKYKKIVRTSMTLHAHDEANDAHIGDTVVVTESRPLSATKRWRLVEVVERAR